MVATERPTTKADNMNPTHAKVWISGPSALVTEMANSGKRGKVCRTFNVSTWNADGSQLAMWIRFTLGERSEAGATFDELHAEAVKHSAGMASVNFTIATHEIRGVDAPRELLTAGVADVWSASADEDGIRVADHTDTNNDPRWITSRQTKAAAYACASKVWGKLSEAKSAHEAASILTAGGATLHGYCARD